MGGIQVCVRGDGVRGKAARGQSSCGITGSPQSSLEDLLQEDHDPVEESVPEPERRCARGKRGLGEWLELRFLPDPPNGPHFFRNHDSNFFFPPPLRRTRPRSTPPSICENAMCCQVSLNPGPLLHPEESGVVGFVFGFGDGGELSP